MSAAREAILGRIRAAGAAAPPAPPPGYRTHWDASPATITDRLVERLEAYGVHVERAPEAAIAATAERLLAAQGVTSLIIPPGLPPAWRPRHPTPIEDAGQDAHALDRIASVMTGCALAIAETGTIVLDAGPGQGRRAVTLVPDFYVCVVLAAQVVGIVPEAIARLHGAAQARRPITFISGPSATADIELDRVAGVHGPRTLMVILAG